MKRGIAYLVLVAISIPPCIVSAECTFIDRGDKIEAVCVGNQISAPANTANGNNLNEINSLNGSKDSELYQIDQLRQELERVNDKISELTEEKKNMNGLMFSIPPMSPSRGMAIRELGRISDEIIEQKKEESRYKSDIRKHEGDLAGIQRRLNEAKAVK